ncbi:MAG: MFS transporter [Akkermansiaceae bacterium]|nr:MFS transporter [Akkermansiaceae bacterium]
MPSTDKLLNKGFFALMLTQFFGALNDNLLKGVLSFAVASGGIWASKLGEGGQAYVGLCLTVPFILLSGIAGQLADRNSKSRITTQVKVAEIAIAAIGFYGFLSGNIWVALGAMLLLAIQSAFFGPAKYGMIPELIADRHLSQANGSINMFTNLAAIGGTVIAGFIYGWYDPKPPIDDPTSVVSAAKLWAPGTAFLLVAALGLAASTLLPKLSAARPSLKVSLNILGPYVSALKEMSRSSLLLVALAWAFFYMVGMISILILPDYRDLLDISPEKASMLMAVLGVAIGIGSVSAGLISGKRIEPRLIPVGAVGMTVFFILLGSTPLSFGLAAALLTGAGIFAGLYIVPLQSLLQHLSPADERGRFLGTANGLSFVFSTTGSLLFLFLRKSQGMPSNRIFLVTGILSILGTGILLWRLRKLFNDPKARGDSHPA